MPRWTAAAALTLLAVTACRSSRPEVEVPPKKFCDAAVDYEAALERGDDVDQQIPIVRRMRDAAPAEIAHDAEVFVRALEAVSDDPDNPELRDDPDVQASVEAVNRYASQGCELFAKGGAPI